MELDERFAFDEPTESEVIAWEAARVVRDQRRRERIEAAQVVGERFLNWIAFGLAGWFVVFALALGARDIFRFLWGLT